MAYTDAESVSLNVGFYYKANAAGRLLGTLLSGGLFLVGGMQACLWASSLLVALAFLAGLRLPPPRGRSCRQPEWLVAGIGNVDGWLQSGSIWPAERRGIQPTDCKSPCWIR